MKRVSTVELIRNFGMYSDAALSRPVVITKNGRDRLVLISIEHYNTLQHPSGAPEEPRPRSQGERVKLAHTGTTVRRKG